MTFWNRTVGRKSVCVHEDMPSCLARVHIGSPFPTGLDSYEGVEFHCLHVICRVRGGETKIRARQGTLIIFLGLRRILGDANSNLASILRVFVAVLARRTDLASETTLRRMVTLVQQMRTALPPQALLSPCRCLHTKPISCSFIPLLNPVRPCCWCEVKTAVPLLILSASDHRRV